MRRAGRLICPLLCLSLGFAWPHAAMAKVQLLEAGIICPEIRETRQQMDAPGTVTGFVDLVEGDIAFDLPDRQVPLIRHLSFGMRVALKAGEPQTPITVVVEHPPTGPEGVTRESWTDLLEAGSSSMNFFTFDYPYEMVPGPWIFSIEIAGQRHVEVPFIVGPPGSNPRVDQVCLGILNS